LIHFYKRDIFRGVFFDSQSMKILYSGHL